MKPKLGRKATLIAAGSGVAALLGWLFGFGQFVAGMHWIFYPFLVDPVEHAWQIPFVAVLFPGGLALFIALAAAVAASLRASDQARVVIFAICYGITEWLRGHLFTGLPWNLPAYSWGASLAVMQSASLFGAYGLSFFTVLFGASLAELLARPRRILLPLSMLTFFALLWLGGEFRLIATPTVMVANANLRVVQPNIPQDEKYRREFVRRNWQRLVDLSKKPPRASSAVIIWPEAAPPVLLQSAPDALDQIAAITGSYNVLITGNQRRAFDSAHNSIFYNSLYIFGHGGQLLSTDHPSGRVIKFPNAKVLTSMVYNYSWPLFPYIWNEIRFQIAYQSDWQFVAKNWKFGRIRVFFFGSMKPLGSMPSCDMLCRRAKPAR